MQHSTTQSERISVFGAGSYGTALAFCLSRNQVPTLLWGRDEQKMQNMRQTRQNEHYLPGYEFPEDMAIEHNLEKAVSASKDLLVVVPSHSFSDLLKQIKPYVRSEHRLIWATKGLEPETGRLLQEVAQEILGDHMPMAVLSGPTFAKEMAAGMPTAITLASQNNDFLEQFANKLHCQKSFRVYKSNDVIGVQLGGAVKNVVAIGAGISDGVGFGANARTALITRGLAEMTRLGTKVGADPQTFMGMAGLGDLILTCTDNQSRNRRFGLALGQGKGVEEAMQAIGQVVEGYRNTKEVYVLAQRFGVEVPITEQIYQVLYENKPIKEATMALLGRQMKFE
ncbi:NAD(P)H-dependent glycerol-3-phosphate dehydrogenase [Alteromonas sp. a30]|uniref:NAD(P)H-dependent glycerol-3-phosphate dehydrogenase n=1 Tax=Alteromonas sp. a30 TaxID=2730917 RepID=UPI0022802FFA|nr:NAD(P)H-dependent glycerol-3-phosphate dehydrogenase [Alteromonas sp. a30]MCY7295389.1 NAD(P)H-dependent glycerol-3-phosphate dehydrogenase [Alteromonas sp. a30]